MSTREKSHPGLPWYASRDNDNVRALQGLRKTVVWGQVALNLCWGGDMGKVGGNTRRIHDIIETQGGDSWVRLEKQGEGLTNTTFQVD